MSQTIDKARLETEIGESLRRSTGKEGKQPIGIVASAAAGDILADLQRQTEKGR